MQAKGNVYWLQFGTTKVVPTSCELLGHRASL
jgi:hypothetical protein